MLVLFLLAFVVRLAVVGASYLAPTALAVRDYRDVVGPCRDRWEYLNRRPQCALLADDERAYDALGRSIAAGTGFRLETGWLQAIPGTPTAVGNFAYPAFVGVVYLLSHDSVLVLLLLQSAIGAAAVVGAAWVGARAGGTVAGAIAGLVAALHPGLALDSAWVMSEALEAPLLVAVLVTWVRLYDRRSMGAAVTFGAAAAAAILTRSPALYAVPLMVAASLTPREWRDHALAKALAVAAATALILMAPWVARNARLFGAFVPTDTKQGPSVWLFNHPSPHPLRDVWAGTPRPQPPPGPIAGLDEVQADRYFRRLALRYVASEPVTVAEVSALRLGLALVPVPRYWGRWPALRAGVAALYIALTWLGLAGLWRVRRQMLGRAMIGLGGTWLILMSLTAVGLRHRLSVEWLFVVGAGVALASVMDRGRWFPAC
jgi:hypothetical protein